MKLFDAPVGVRFRSDQAVISAPIAATMVEQDVLDVTGGVPGSAQIGDLVLYGTMGPHRWRVPRQVDRAWR